ncbi:MAG: hypothetical protein NC045_03835, partial [Bacteroides sp.]|nr:hypothetical protein [Bacteroides sp.]
PLESVYYLSENLKSFDSFIFSDSIYDNAILYLAEAAIAERDNVEPWKRFKNVKEMDISGITDVEADGKDVPAEYYNLNGVKVNGNALIPGIYIRKQGTKVEKIHVN